MNDMQFFFLSYNRVQLYFAEALAYELAAAGVRTWFDLQRLKPGSNWEAAIQRGLDNSSGVILVASKAALKSPYVELEWRHALETGKPIYLVLFEPVDLPPELQGAVVFSSDRPFADLIKQLVECIQTGKKPQADPHRFRLFPMAMQEDARWIAGLLLIDGVIFVLVGWATANAYFFRSPGHWVNILYRMAIPFSDRINFNWIPFVMGGAILWGFWDFWRHRGTTASLTMTLILTGLTFTVVSVGVFFASINPLFEPGRSLVRMLCAIGVGLGLLNLFYLVRLARGIPSVLRWIATNGASPEYRQSIYKRLPGAFTIARRGIKYRLEYSGQEASLGDTIRQRMKFYGHTEVRESRPEILCLVVITPQMSPRHVQNLMQQHSQFIPILAGDVDIDLYGGIGAYQIVDYRLQEISVLNALAAYLAEPTLGGFELGRVITPRSIQRPSLLMRYMALERSTGWGNNALTVGKVFGGCAGQVMAILLCFFVCGFAMSVLDMATKPYAPNSLRDLASPEPTPLYTRTPRPTLTPLPPLLVDLAGMRFELAGHWSAVEVFTVEPYRTMLEDHESMQPIWGATNNTDLWMMALDYPSAEAVAALWTAVGDSERQSVETGIDVQADWFERKHTTVTVLRGQTEWMLVVDGRETIIVFHVLGGGEWGFSESLPDEILTFAQLVTD